MSIEQINKLQRQLDVFIQQVSSDPTQQQGGAYDRCMEKVLSRLQESQMWMHSANDALKNAQAE